MLFLQSMKRTKKSQFQKMHSFIFTEDKLKIKLTNLAQLQSSSPGRYC